MPAKPKQLIEVHGQGCSLRSEYSGNRGAGITIAGPATIVYQDHGTPKWIADAAKTPA
jgi:hypothetical protein